MRFENETVILEQDGAALSCYNKEDFIAETLPYRHNKTLRDLLTSQWLQQKTPAEAIAYIREKAGARTREEGFAAKQAKLDAKAASKRPVGRPRIKLTVGDLQRAVAMAVLKVTVSLEAKDMEQDARTMLEGVKRQALQQLGGAA